MLHVIRRTVLASVVLAATGTGASANGFFVEPEAVFLKFSETDLPFAVVGEAGDTIDEGSLVEIDSDYEAGFRIGVGYAWEGWWDFTVRYTHLSTHEHGTADDSLGSLWATTTHPTDSWFDSDEFRRIDSELELDLDYADIEIGKTWNCDNGGSLRLFFGARLSWFDQDSASIHFEQETVWEVTETWLDWKGWGPLVGIEGELPLGESGWSVFGTFAASLQFGDVTGRYFDVYVPVSTMKEDTELVTYSYIDDTDTTASVFEGRIGFAWERRFERVTFGLRFGYEYQVWNELATTASLIENATTDVPVLTSHDTVDSGRGEDLEANEDIQVHGFFFGLVWAW